ncbi:hypothetical protein GGF37_000427 [Kickxella alabastrina]|nr:hypothetical protein GGF37_000427 [Kickxella alabastrina]
MIGSVHIAMSCAYCKVAGGNLPSDLSDASAETLLGAPTEHPSATTTYAPSQDNKKMHENGLFTFGHTFKGNPDTRATRSREGPHMSTFINAVKPDNSILSPNMGAHILNHPTTPDPRAIWTAAQIGDTSLEAYRPKYVRLGVTRKEEAAPL